MSDRRLYKYVSIDGLKRMIGASASIRFTQPGAFNDPFELLPELVMKKDSPATAGAFSFDLYAPRRSPPVGDVLEVGDEFVSSDINSRNILRELDKQIGIYCLSKVNDSILMWSHYADQYAGAVVGFDADHEFLSRQFDIEYRSTRPKKEFTSYSGSPIPISELCAKSDHWAYEQEVRIVRPLVDCKSKGKKDGRGFGVYTQKIPENCVQTITLGERTSVQHQREVYAMVKGTEIGLALLAVDNAGYGFRQEIIKYPGSNVGMGPTVSPRTAHIFKDLRTPLGEMARWMIDKHPASPIVNNLA